MTSNSPTPSPSKSELARQFIDDVMKINDKFGMGTVTTEGAYDTAVSHAAETFSWVNREAPQSH